MFNIYILLNFGTIKVNAVTGGRNMNFFVDYLVELGLDAGKDYLIDKKKDVEVKECLRDYVERQSNINEMCGLAEEIDFQGLAKYILSELLFDVKVYLFGKKPDRVAMKKIIISKAFSHSKADDKKQKDKPYKGSYPCT